MKQQSALDALLAHDHLFVTGTDTGVGKTVVSCAIARAWRARGLEVCAVKPVAAGGELDAQGTFRCEDATLLHDASSDNGRQVLASTQSLSRGEPLVGLLRPMAPWSAARLEGRSIDVEGLLAQLGLLASACGRAAMKCVIEGAGGALVPLAPGFTMADLIARSGTPAVIVARTQLGTINHTLLTIEALRSRGIAIAAIVFSRMQPGCFNDIERASVFEIHQFVGNTVPLLLAPHCAAGQPGLEDCPAELVRGPVGGEGLQRIKQAPSLDARNAEFRS